MTLQPECGPSSTSKFHLPVTTWQCCTTANTSLPGYVHPDGAPNTALVISPFHYEIQNMNIPKSNILHSCYCCSRSLCQWHRSAPCPNSPKPMYISPWWQQLAQLMNHGNIVSVQGWARSGGNNTSQKKKSIFADKLREWNRKPQREVGLGSRHVEQRQRVVNKYIESWQARQSRCWYLLRSQNNYIIEHVFARPLPCSGTNSIQRLCLQRA
jgi:hypothetical protein